MHQLKELGIDLSSEEDFQRTTLELLTSSSSALDEMCDTGELEAIPYSLDFLAEEVINSKLHYSTSFDEAALEFDCPLEDHLVRLENLTRCELLTDDSYADMIMFAIEFTGNPDIDTTIISISEDITLKEYYKMFKEHEDDLLEIWQITDFSAPSISLEGLEFYAENKDRIKEMLESDKDSLSEEDKKILDDFYEYTLQEREE